MVVQGYLVYQQSGIRVAQTVVAQFIEPKLEPLFHPDSYGYRPNKSALDAVGQVREEMLGVQLDFGI